MAGSFFEAFLLAMRLMFVRLVFFVVSSRGLPVALLYMTGNLLFGLGSVHIYVGGVQIEEGEVDTERGRLFSSCFRKLHKKELDEIAAEKRRERAAAKGKK